MSKIKISIIVPVYNVVDLLERCIKTLMNQTLKEIEIILVDDGSTDDSGKMCDDFAKKDKRIKAVHQPNKGLSGARNTGLKMASGEYVLFIDSDDYIDLKSCEVLYNKGIEFGADIIASNSMHVVDGIESVGLDRKMEENKVYDGTYFLWKNIQQNTVSMMAQLGLYNLNFLKSTNIVFKEGILHEDELWTPQIYLAAQKVVYCDFKFYYYCIRSNSISNTKNYDKRSKDIINTTQTLYKKYIELDDKYQKVFLNNLCTRYLSAIGMAKFKDADAKFALKTAGTLKNRLKAILYYLSPSLYFRINKMSKKL